MRVEHTLMLLIMKRYIHNTKKNIGPHHHGIITNIQHSAMLYNLFALQLGINDTHSLKTQSQMENIVREIFAFMDHNDLQL